MTSSSTTSDSRRREWLVVAAILLVALTLRLLHLREVALHDPYYTLPTVDDVQYDHWAKRLVAGDGLVDGVLYLGPGYPIFMAGIYALFGPSLAAVKAVQSVLGAMSCLLFYGLARELFDRRVAAGAGLLAAGYAMLVFYGGTIMTVNLKVPLVVGLAWAMVRATARPGALAFATAGLLLGLATLVQQTILPVLGLALGWILLAPPLRSLPLARRALLAGLLLASTAACILPFTLHNWRSGKDLVLLNSMGGANFYMGNQPGADGTWQPPHLGFRIRADNPDEMQRQFRVAAEHAAGRALLPSEVSAHWMARGIEEIRRDPDRWLRLEARKLALHFNAYEVWNIRSIELSREGSRILQLPLATLGFVAPLGLLGMLISASRWRELAPLYGIMLVYLASSLLIFVLARYRLPGVILFIPFAAFALIRIFDALRQRELRFLSIAAIGLAVSAVLVHLPLESSDRRMHMAYYNLGNKYKELERWDEAIAAYHDSLARVPDAISTRNNLALAFEGAGRREEAIAAWRDVLARAQRQRDRVRIERAERHLETLGAGPAPGAAGSPTRSLESLVKPGT